MTKIIPGFEYFNRVPRTYGERCVMQEADYRGNKMTYAINEAACDIWTSLTEEEQQRRVTMYRQRAALYAAIAEAAKS